MNNKRIVNLCYVALTGFFCFLCLDVAQGQQESAVLRELASRFRDFQSVEESGVSEVRALDITGEEFVQRTEFAYRADANRFLLSKTTWDGPGGGAERLDRDRSRRVSFGWDDNRWVEYQDEVVDNDDTVFTRDNASRGGLLKSVDYPAGVLAGYLPGDTVPWWSLLGEGGAEWTSYPDRVDGATGSTVYESQAAGSTYRFWVAADDSSAVTKIEVTRTPEASFLGEKLSNELPPAFAGGEEGVSRTGFTFTMENIEYVENADGQLLPVSAEWSSRTRYSNGKEDRLVGSVQKDRMEVNLAFQKGDFVPDIPEGTRAHIFGVDQVIPHQWIGGGVQPVVD